MDKILVIRLSSLGDVLLASPAVRAIRKRFPDARVDFLTKAHFAPLFRNNPHVSRVIGLGSGDAQGIFHMRHGLKTGYDLIVDLHGNLRSRILTGGPGMPRILRTKKYSLRRRLLACSHVNLMKKAPCVAERYLACLESIGARDDGLGLEFHPDESAVRRAEGLLARSGVREKEAIGLAVGSRWYTKKWPLDHLIGLVKLMQGEKFILLGSGEDNETACALAAALPGRTVNFTGMTDIATAGALIRSCRALVANDSGLMHLGCAVGTPVVALFGSTVREFGFFPFRARAVVLEKPLKCRPCTTQGREHCRLGTLECLESIRPEEVAAALQSFQAGD